MEFLDTPFPEDVTPDAKSIVEDVEKWRKEEGISKNFFATRILKISRQRYGFIVNLKAKDKPGGTGKMTILRLYNWLMIPEEKKNEILKMETSRDSEDGKMDLSGNWTSSEMENFHGIGFDLDQENVPIYSQDLIDWILDDDAPISPDDVVAKASTPIKRKRRLSDLINFQDSPPPEAEDVVHDTKSIIENVEKWRENSNLSLASFSRKVLNLTERRYRFIVSMKNMKRSGAILKKMHDWLKTSEEEKIKILKRSDVLDKPIPKDVTVGTKSFFEDVENCRRKLGITQHEFSERILARSQGTYSDLKKKVKKWGEMRIGKAVFVRMYNWLKVSDEEKLEMLERGSETKKTLSSPPKAKRARLEFTDKEKEQLSKIFSECKYPSPARKEEISKSMNLPLESVDNFFQNARRRMSRNK